MTLPPANVEQFFRAWWPLLAYVNRAKNLVKNWPATPDAGKMPPDKAVKIRDALWADDALRERFLAENPAGLSEDDLALVKTWSHRVAGRFVVLRQLKKHAVVTAREDEPQRPRAYAVLGLVSALGETLPHPPPMVAEMVLLPFKDRIIYDGLVRANPVLLGPNIRARLNAEWGDIQEGEGLITSLPPDPAQMEANVAAGNTRLLKAFRAHLAGSGLSETLIARHADAVAALPTNGPLLDADLSTVQAHLSAHPSAAASFKRFVRFLEETGRGDPERVWALQAIRRRSSSER